MKQIYFEEVDIAKGVAILLVILGHSFCTYPFDLNGQFPLLAAIVRSFQMPLFFVASGFLFSATDGFGEFLQKKASRLVIPYLAFGLLTVILRMLFGAFTHSGAIDIGEGLTAIATGQYYWFLYTLLLLLIAARLIKSRIILSAVALLSVIICLYTDIQQISIFTFGRTVYFFFFFACGILLRKWYPWITERRWGGVIILTCTSLFIYVISIYPSDISGIAIIQKYVIPLSGSAFVWGAASILAGSTRTQDVTKLLVHFGRYSLQYYLNHLLIMLPLYYMVGKLQLSNPLLSLLLIFAGGVVVSWIMLRIEKQTPLLRFLCGLKS